MAKPEMFSLSVPSFHQEVSKMLMDVPVAEWQRATCASTRWMAPRRS
jgi:hypothetical protein